MPGMTSALRTVVGRLPAGPGVYRFRDARGRVLYVGRASVLRHRVGSYWTDLRDRRHLRRMVPQIVRIEAVACDSVHEAVWLERNLLERVKPRWNRIRGGTEVPVCIRLEQVAASPRLTVRHWPLVEVGGGPAAAAETFGPYLGGTRARLAVSALDRVLPLRYTEDRLDGGRRDLARIRGVEVADRDRFLATVTGVLRRQPADVETVREQLVRHRDRASANLAFELAARIQLEIEAVDWVVAEQKVTQLLPTVGPSAGARTPADCEAYGWDDGLLIGFRVRRGRLCGWDQRTCRWPAAQPYLERTPATWSAFASRNAELGRRLAEAHPG
jgi:excinuclease ABC subunit C